MTAPTPPARWERWLPLLFVALAAMTVAPIFRYPHLFAQQYDWRYFQSWIEVGRRSLLWYGQVPLWNPYGCGGEVLLANPQSEVASPTFLFPLIFGTALGVKLVIVFYLFCAFDGMYRLGRSLDVSPAGALFASVLFGGGGWLALHLSSGHSNFASASLFPYLVLFYRRGIDAPEWAIPLGAVAAWTVALGGTSTPAMATVLLATVATVDAIAKRSWRPYRVLLFGAACAAIVGAARLLPALEFAIDHPRRQWETDASTLFEIIRNGFWWKGMEPIRGKRYWFHEYGYRLAYVCIPFICYAAGAAIVRLVERLRKRPVVTRPTDAWWIVILVGVGIVAGRAIPFGPWWLLKHLPIYRDLRVPSRYAILLALALPIVCGGALDELLAWLRGLSRPTLARAIAVALIAIAFVDGAAFSWTCWNKIFNMPVTAAPEGTPFYQVRGDWQSMMFRVFEGHGAIGCDEEAPLQRAKELDEGNLPQVKLADPAAGTIGATRWTPNRVEVELTLSAPTTVLFNQNWNEHWKTSAGRVVRFGPKVERDHDGGRLGVEAPAGTYTLSVTYRPTSFVVGAIISGLGIPLALALFLWARRRRRL